MSLKGFGLEFGHLSILSIMREQLTLGRKSRQSMLVVENHMRAETTA